MAPFEKQWEQCLAIIRENLQNEDAYQAFFASVRAGEFKDGRLTLLVPSHYVYETLESDQYYNLLSKTFWRVFGPNASIKYRIGVVKTSDDDVHDDNASVKLNPKNRIEAAPESNFESHLNPNCTLSAFCPGKSNELALSAGLTVSNRPGNSAFNPFFIFGASGVGKTHLAQAIGLKILENDPTKRVLYVTAYQFKVQYTDAVRQNRLNDFINFYQSIDVLIVDDIQEFAGKNLIATQNTFFHIFNHLHQLGKQLVMTCDRPPVELEDLVPRLLTRFKWGFIGEIERPDYELRKGILRSKCEKEGITIHAGWGQTEIRTADGKCAGISIIKHSETSVLGEVAASASERGVSFRNSFIGKDESITIGDIDAITGATITSKAVTGAVATAIEAVKSLG